MVNMSVSSSHPNPGSRFFNHQKYLSIVLLGLGDANMKFIAVDVGAYRKFGRFQNISELCDGSGIPIWGIWRATIKASAGCCWSGSVFSGYRRWGICVIHLPPQALHEHGLNSRKRIFNYWMSRARRMVECAFGICTAKWRVLLTSMHLEVDHAVIVVF